MTDISALAASTQKVKRSRKLDYSVLFVTISAASMAYAGSNRIKFLGMVGQRLSCFDL